MSEQMKEEIITVGDFPFILHECPLSGFKEHYSGKVRECYLSGNVRILIATDRLSCFDRIIGTIPFKGQILTQLSSFWFERIKGQVPTHFIAQIDPCAMAVKSAEVIPFEVVVRGYLAGSAWRAYRDGVSVPGLELPTGMREFDPLPEAVITPSTKEFDGGHDIPVSAEDVCRSGKVTAAEWASMTNMALELFAEGQRYARTQGLLLADTKYEFGRIGGKVVLIDEVHTLDSSRYWEALTYTQRIQDGKSPIMLDKEPVRQWLLAQGYRGEGEPPQVPDTERVAIASHYTNAYHRISGRQFVPDRSPPLSRIVKSLRGFGIFGKAITSSKNDGA